MTAPGWFADPAGGGGLRYWDGTTWTDHVAVPASVVGPPPPQAAPRFGRAAGWAGLVSCVVAAIAIGMPATAGVRGEHGTQLEGTRQQLALEPDTTYGVYVDDADNSGYSWSCSGTRADGRPVELKSPSWSLSESDTETLEYVFQSGTGHVTFTCAAAGERVSVRPYVSPRPLVIGLLVGGVAGTIGVTLLILWMVARLERRSGPRRRLATRRR